MKVIRLAAVLMFLGLGINAFAYNDNNPGDDFRSCPPGFSRDVFGDCQPNYTFPGGRGHDDYGTRDDFTWPNDGRGSHHSSLHTCYAKDRRGLVLKASGRNLARVQQRVLNGCVSRSSKPRTCRLVSCD